MSRRPRSVKADIDLIARPDAHMNNGAHGGMQVSTERYLLLKNGATNRLNRHLLIGHPERMAWRWHAKQNRWRRKRGWK